MSGLDTTGRTNGVGDHFTVAGVEYVWTIGDTGRLCAVRFDRDEFLAKLKQLTEHLGEARAGLLVDQARVLSDLRPGGLR